MEIDTEFATLLNQAVLLNPYAYLYRYPEGELLPTPAELSVAIQAAREEISGREQFSSAIFIFSRKPLIILLEALF